MSDWDFLHDMHNRGCSTEDLMDAMATGCSPEDLAYLERQESKAQWEELKSLRDSGEISREEFKIRKNEIFPKKF